MQIRRATDRHIFLDPLFECRSARQSAGHDVTSQRLGFHDRDVWLARDWDEIVRRTALHRSSRTEMKRHRNLMHSFSVEMHRTHTATNERARFDCSAQTDDRNEIAVVDL